VTVIALHTSLLQGIDALVGNLWDSRNAGKLFKHLTIPEAQE
jgi:hypothetical protein